MNKYSKYTRLVAKFLIFMLTVTTALFGIPPETVSAGSPQDLLNYVPVSKPENPTITWYDALRTGEAMTSIFIGDLQYDLYFGYGSAQPVLSQNAFKNKDRSKVVGSEKIKNLNFDMLKWVRVENANAAAGTRSVLTWGEVSGYIRVPEDGDFCISIPYNSPASYELELDGEVVASNWMLGTQAGQALYSPDNYELELVTRIVDADWVASKLTSKGYELMELNALIHDGIQDTGGEFKAFRLRIGCPYEDSRKDYDTHKFILKPGILSIYDWFNEKTAVLRDNNVTLYTTLALRDMKKFFKINTTDFTLNLDPELHKTFPASDYVYGICTGDPYAAPAENLKTLKLGSNVLDRVGGKVFVRNKTHPKDYIVIDTLSTLTVNDLMVKERTPYTADLTWTAPLCGLPVTGYDIYRRAIGVTESRASFSMHTASDQYEKVGSTTQFSYTDQGLKQDEIYEYYIVTNYVTVPGQKSNLAKTDSVAMTGVPGMPTELRVGSIKQGKKSDLTLHWDETPPTSDLKEYVVYRKLTEAPEPTQNTGTGSGFMILTSAFPEEIGRTARPSFTDVGLDYGDTCDYYVQAVFKNGPPSFITAPLHVVVKDETAPTAPGNLKIGNVLRQGEDVRYDFPDNPGIGNAFLGPRREVALQWDPSEDNTGVAGYDVYRKAFGKDLKDDTYWEEKEHFVGSTTDSVFVDSGLKLGAYYFYCVEAKDKDGLKTRSEAASINTMKSTLSDLSIKNGSKALTPSPAFAYYDTDYTLDVTNEVSAIRLIPQKTDSLSEVRIKGIGVDGGIDLKLDPGENIIPIEVRQSSVTQETMNYTLTVNRANLEDLPALNLTDPGAAIKEGDIYKASGSIELQASRDWLGFVDYGDGTGIQPLKPDKDGSYVLEHKYLDNGQFKVDVIFRYFDKGMVKASLEAAVDNVAPIMTGVKDEYTVKEGELLKIDGIVADPGQDGWFVTGYADGLGSQIRTEVMADKTFSLGEIVFDKRPEYDLRLQVTDDDGGTWSKIVKLKVENVAPIVQTKGVPMVQRGGEFIGSGSFADPGLDQWNATVDYGDGSGRQPLNLKADKTFDLKHVFHRNGNYTVTVHVEDQDQGVGDALLQVKVKDYVSTLELGEDISLKEGDTLERGIPVWGFSHRISKILVDYGDGSGEKSVALTANKSGANPISDSTASVVSSARAALVGSMSLQHTYKDNGTYTVKAKIVDMDGDVYEDSFKAEAANVAPTVQLSGGVIYAGDTFTCRGTVTDPGDDAWTVEISSSYGFQPLKISLGSDKTFSFSRTFNRSGIFDIAAAVTDDDGGVGYGAGQLTVNRRPSTSVSVSNDATLYSLAVGAPLTQNESPTYTAAVFVPECLNYTVPGSTGSLHVIATADSGATLQYYDYATSSWTGFSPSPGAFDFAIDSTHPLSIRVTAANGVTTKTYVISQ